MRNETTGKPFPSKRECMKKDLLRLAPLGWPPSHSNGGTRRRRRLPCRASIAEFHSEKDSSNETVARVILLRSLVAQKKLGEAQNEMKQVVGLAANASQRNLRYSALTTSARLRATLGGESNVAGAVQALQRIATEAGKAGMPGFELDARLAIGEIEAAGGQMSRARIELGAVQREAAAKGFLLISQKAIQAEK